MAQYAINYACGHGSTTKQLYGKTAERERKIAWMEQNMVCPDCYKTQQQAKDDNAPKVATLHTLADCRLFITIDGQINKHKDQLSGLGYGFSKDFGSGGIKGLLETKAPQWQLVKCSEVIESEAQAKEWVSEATEALKEVGYELKIGISTLDFNLFIHQIQNKQAAKAQEQAWLDKNPKPASTCFDFMRERHGDALKRWNGKIYGRKGSYNYYVDNVKYTMTDEQEQAITDWRAKNKAWQEAKKEAGV